MTDRNEIIALAKQQGAELDQSGCMYLMYPSELQAFFHAAQRLALEGVGILATVGATYPELMDYLQSELETIRNLGTK